MKKSSHYISLVRRMARCQSSADWISKASEVELYEVAAHDADEVAQRDARRALISRATQEIDEKICLLQEEDEAP